MQPRGPTTYITILASPATNLVPGPTEEQQAPRPLPTAYEVDCQSLQLCLMGDERGRFHEADQAPASIGHSTISHELVRVGFMGLRAEMVTGRADGMPPARLPAVAGMRQ